MQRFSQRFPTPYQWVSRRATPTSSARLFHRGVPQRYSSYVGRPATANVRPRFTEYSRRSSSFVSDEPTIYALSTAPGRAAIAVIRISGPACLQVYNSLCPNHKVPRARYASLRTLYDPSCAPSTQSILDPNALVFYFPAPETVTGEDVLELHVHGGPAVIQAVLNAIPACTKNTRANAAAEGIRYAEPGEFTRRAFLNDRLDLTQVEALGNTLAADTEQQRRLAVRGTNDSLGKRYQEWQRQLLYARGELEALIDFSEDQHFDESPRELVDSITQQVLKLKRALKVYIENASKGELLRKGISIALLGAPNAGKSSLLNRIVGREAAIVSREEGTTRDIVDVGVDIGGWFCRLGDMAGLRSSSSVSGQLGESSIGEVEQEGIRRARERALASDVVIVVLSLEKDGNGPPRLKFEPEVVDAARSCMELNKQLLVVINKTDLADPTSLNGIQSSSELSAAVRGIRAENIFPISCKAALEEPLPSTDLDPGNIQGLLQGLIRTFAAMSAPSSLASPDASATREEEDMLGVTHRQSANLQACLKHLDDFLEQAGASPLESYEDSTGDEVDVVAAAEHLRFAAQCLARITGRGEGVGDVEEVLGVVFEKFCVGK